MIEQFFLWTGWTWLGRIVCWITGRHKYHATYFGHCSYDSVDGLSDITYSTEYFCDICGRMKQANGGGRDE